MPSPRIRAVVLLVAILALVGGTVAVAAQSGGDAPAKTESSSTEPDLSGVPKVVATVDGVDITREQFEQTYTAQFQIATQQAQTSGQPVDQDELKKQTVETMVDTQVLVAESESRKYDITQKDLDAALAELTEQNGLQDPAELVAALGEQGLDENEVNRQLEQQVRIDRLVEEESGDLTPSDADLQKVYDQVVAQQGAGADLPTFAEAKAQLAEQGRQENESAAARTLAAELRKDAKVEIRL